MEQTATNMFPSKEELIAEYRNVLLLCQKKWINHEDIKTLYGKSRFLFIKYRQDKTMPLRTTKFPGDKEIFYLREDIEAILHRQSERLSTYDPEA